jgi:hypothetical protein
MREFWSLTKQGLEFGKNLVNHDNQRHERTCWCHNDHKKAPWLAPRGFFVLAIIFWQKPREPKICAVIKSQSPASASQTLRYI